MTKILRSKATQERFGVAKTAFHDNFVWHPGSPDGVAGTKAVPRLSQAMINDKVAVTSKTRSLRSLKASAPSATPGYQVDPATRNTAGKFVESNKPRSSKKPTSALQQSG